VFRQITETYSFPALTDVGRICARSSRAMASSAMSFRVVAFGCSFLRTVPDTALSPPRLFVHSS
jgi:hypothetical protein